MRVIGSCPCSGDGFAPEHGLSDVHLAWLGMATETEAGFTYAIAQLAGRSGWLVYHTYDSRRSTPGFPDLVLVKRRVLWRELKLDKGRTTKEQDEWLLALVAAGQDAGIWRPRDWDHIVEELSR